MLKELVYLSRSYLAMDSSFDAAKVIAKKNDPVSLKTAASLAKIAGESDLSYSLSLRCAKDLASSQDWLGAQQLLIAQESILVSCPELANEICVLIFMLDLYCPPLL